MNQTELDLRRDPEPLAPLPPQAAPVRHGQHPADATAARPDRAHAAARLLATLVHDEMQRRQDRLIERRIKKAGFRDHDKTLDNFDFNFNPKMDKKLIFELAAGRFITQREEALFLGPARHRQEPPRGADRTRRDPPGLRSPLQGSAPARRGTRRRHARRHAQGYLKEVGGVPLLIIGRTVGRSRS